jgi:hypothetical protein
MAKTPIAVETTLSTSRNAYISVLPLLNNRLAWRGDGGTGHVSSHAYPPKSSAAS